MDKETKLESFSNNSMDVTQISLAAQLQLLQQLNDSNISWPLQEGQIMTSLSSNPSAIALNTVPQTTTANEIQNLNQQNLNLLQLFDTSLIQGNDSAVEIQNLDQNILNSKDFKVIDGSLLQQIYNMQQLPTNNDNSGNFGINSQDITSVTPTVVAPIQKPRSYTRPPKKPLTPYMIFSKQVLHFFYN